MGLYASPRLLPAGDAAVSIELADEISRDANARALTLERLLLDAQLPGLVDTVPTFRALLVHYDPLVLPWTTLEAKLHELSGRLADAPPRRVAGWSSRAPTAGPTARPRGGRAPPGSHPGGGRQAPRGSRALRVFRGLHSRPPVHGRAARPLDDPAARPPADQDAARAASRSAERRPPSTRSRARAASGCSAGRRSGSTTPARRSRSSSAPATTCGSSRSSRPSTTRSPRRSRPATYRARIGEER